MTNLLDVISAEVKLKKVASTNGGEWAGPCPGCDGEDRFRVWPNHSGGGRWWCRQCDKKGDAIGYLMEFRGMSFPEAKQHLGVELPPQTTPRTQLEPEKEQEQRLVRQKLMAEFVKDREQDLWKGGPALDYLHARGLKDETIRTMRLGFNARERFVGRGKAVSGVTIPWFLNGDLVAVNIRRLKPKTDKDRYQAVGGSTKTGYHLPGDEKTLVILEGELDGGLVWQSLKMSVLATGTADKSIDDALKELVKRFECVVLIPDNDDAGEKMVQKWQTAFEGIQVFRLPSDVHDIGDFVMRGHSLDVWWRSQDDAAGKADKPVEKKAKTAPQVSGKAVEQVPDKTTLFRLAKKRYVVFEDQFGEQFAQYQTATHAEIAPIRSKTIRDDLSQLFMRHSTDKPAGRATVDAVIDTGLVTLKDGERALYGRTMTEADSRTVRYDLCNDRWQTVTIRPSGWEFETMAHPVFRRYKHQRPQCKPVPGGDINELWKFLPQLGNEETESKHRLMTLVFLVGGIVLSGRSTFALLLNGIEGSGKSTAAWCLRELIDPSASPICRDIYDLGKLVHYLCHNRVCILDNLTSIRPDLSDLLSASITGAGDTKRKHYTDDEDVVRIFQPVIIITSISNVVKQPDLLDRCISIRLERLPEPKAEQTFKKEFLEAKPRIFGALLDVISKAMGIYPDVELVERCRMADAARWGVAVARALGHQDDDFYEAYSTNASNNLESIMDSDIVAATTLEFLKGRPGHEFRGTPTALYEALTSHVSVGSPPKAPKSWPGDPPWMTKRLKALQRPLENAGIYLESRPGKQRTIILQLEQEPEWVDEDDDGNCVPKDDGGDSRVTVEKTLLSSP